MLAGTHGYVFGVGDAAAILGATGGWEAKRPICSIPLGRARRHR